MYDVTLQSSAENASSPWGHATANNHIQLAALLDGILQLQQGNDTQLERRCGSRLMDNSVVAKW